MDQHDFLLRQCRDTGDIYVIHAGGRDDLQSFLVERGIDAMAAAIRAFYG